MNRSLNAQVRSYAVDRTASSRSSYRRPSAPPAPPATSRSSRSTSMRRNGTTGSQPDQVDPGADSPPAAPAARTGSPSAPSTSGPGACDQQAASPSASTGTSARHAGRPRDPAQRRARRRDPGGERTSPAARLRQAPPEPTGSSAHLNASGPPGRPLDRRPLRGRLRRARASSAPACCYDANAFRRLDGRPRPRPRPAASPSAYAPWARLQAVDGELRRRSCCMSTPPHRPATSRRVRRPARNRADRAGASTLAQQPAGPLRRPGASSAATSTRRSTPSRTTPSQLGAAPRGLLRRVRDRTGSVNSKYPTTNNFEFPVRAIAAPPRLHPDASATTQGSCRYVNLALHARRPRSRPTTSCRWRRSRSPAETAETGVKAA